LEALLPAYLKGRRWFGGKARPLRSASLPELVPIPYDSAIAYLTAIVVEYTEGDPETYVLPLTVATGERAAQVQKDFPQAVVARVHGTGQEAILCEALWDTSFCDALLTAILRRRRFKGEAGELRALPTRRFRQLYDQSGGNLPASLMPAEQSNTSILYGTTFLLKLFRRVATGVNPDLEIGHFLTDTAAFSHAPAVAGALEYRQDQREPVTVAVLHSFVPNQGDAWHYTLDTLEQYFELALTHRDVPHPAVPHAPLVTMSEEPVPALAQETIGSYLASAQLLGQRTAELHLALASDTTDPHFAPEAFSTLYQRSLYQTMRSHAARSFPLLRRYLKELPPAVRADAQRVLEREQDVLGRFQALLGRKIMAMRIRCHGDYHLGQVLYTGKGFVIIDFEGEPARPLSERRIKCSPLRDVAGMLRSFHYAAYTALFAEEAEGVYASHPEALAALEPWARFWYHWVAAVFLRTYREVASRASFLPRAWEELQFLLDAYLMEKAVYEVGYELNSRPEWVRVPLQGILQLVEAAG
jgi:maltose alpha-D-glucosyltransferase/alpha-amylase